MTMGDRIVVMKDGLIQQVGTSLELFNQPKNLFVAGFIGSPTMNFIPCKIIRENSGFYVSTKGMKLKIPPDKANVYAEHLNRKVILGIRPQYLYSTDLFPGKIEENTFKAVAEVIEPLGSEIIVYIDVKGQSIVGNMSADTELSNGQEFEIAVDMSKMHLFDAESEEVIK
jgi:multiple sugar transport system ATP-binding protein